MERRVTGEVSTPALAADRRLAVVVGAGAADALRTGTILDLDTPALYRRAAGVTLQPFEGPVIDAVVIGREPRRVTSSSNGMLLVEFVVDGVRQYRLTAAPRNDPALISAARPRKRPQESLWQRLVGGVSLVRRAMRLPEATGTAALLPLGVGRGTR